MFRVFKRGKFLKEVYQKIDFFIEMAEVPKTTATMEKIKQEYELNAAEDFDEDLTWHNLLGEQIHQVAWVHRDYLYDRFSANQAAIFCISELICNHAKNGKIEEMHKTDKDLYESFKLLWGMCGYLASDPSHENTYANVVMVPEEGNPFKY